MIDILLHTLLHLFKPRRQVDQVCAAMLLSIAWGVLTTRADDALRARVYTISPGPDVQYRIQARLIEAVAGDVIQLEKGRYDLHRQLDIAADGITLRGRGSDETILSFRQQVAGGYGIEATGDQFTVEGLAVEDSQGNAIKVLGADGVTLRDVRAEWTGPPAATNGAYGLYPVQCKNVLIENCTAIGASDAGLYVGQCHQVVVRGCRAERNVAGIEIENTINADVYDNVAKNNTGGILVFDLPGLQVKAGRNVRVFRNQVTDNNHTNFAAPGSIVASVPPGTGVMIMATDQVEVFDNDITNHQTGNVAVLSYLVLEKKMTDPTYDPYPEAINVHDNRLSQSGFDPQGAFGTLLRPVLGIPFPDMLIDGVVNSKKLVDGKLPGALSLSFVNNGSATFANVNLAELNPQNILTGKYRVERDLAAYALPKDPLPAVTLAEPTEARVPSSSAVRVYRSAKPRLSEYGLFQGDLARQQPAEGVVPYDLNTPLFSDYTTKYRFIKLPTNGEIQYRAQGVMEFPVGTVIAKTFAYPHDMRDLSRGERLLETRIELRQDEGWFGFSYVWNDEQTDAVLALGGGEIEVAWIHADGQSRTNHYQIPNANQCLTCHQSNDQFVPIGPVAANLNRNYEFPHGTENQLEYLRRTQLLNDLPAAESREVWPISDQPSTGSVDSRARTWLHVNCAHCHNPGGTARTSGLDLRLSQSDPAKFGVWKAPVAAGHGSGGREYDLVPGKPDQSILLFRIEADDPSIAMPNVARNLVPIEAAGLIRAWIEQLQP